MQNLDAEPRQLKLSIVWELKIRIEVCQLIVRFSISRSVEGYEPTPVDP